MSFVYIVFLLVFLMVVLLLSERAGMIDTWRDVLYLTGCFFAGVLISRLIF